MTSGRCRDRRRRPGPLTPALLVAAVLVVAGPIVASCSSDGDGTADGSATSAPATSTTLPVADPAAVTDAARRALDFSVPLESRLDVLEDADDLAGVSEVVRVRFAEIGATVLVQGVRGTEDPDEVVAVVDVMRGELPLLNDAPVPVRDVGGGWRVGRDGLCLVIGLVEPCPPQPAGG